MIAAPVLFAGVTVTVKLASVPGSAPSVVFAIETSYASSSVFSTDTSDASILS